MVDFWVKIEFDELDFVIYQYLRWERYKEKRVHWTRLPYMENEFVELVFLVYFFFTANTTNMIWSSAPSLTWFDHVQTQPSSADAARSDQVRHQVLDTIWSWHSHQVQTQPNLIKQPAEHDLIRKQVQWTRFPCILFFHNEQTQPTCTRHDLIKCRRSPSNVQWTCYKWNRVHWTRIAINEISFKPCLTYNIVWVLCLFF